MFSGSDFPWSAGLKGNQGDSEDMITDPMVCPQVQH